MEFFFLGTSFYLSSKSPGGVRGRVSRRTRCSKILALVCLDLVRETPKTQIAESASPAAAPSASPRSTLDQRLIHG